MENRTDLALESYENQQKTVLPGVKVREQDGISVVEVLDARGEKALGKPVGKYITYRVSHMAQETQLFDGRLERIADLLRGLLPDHPTPIEIRTHSSDPVPFVLYDSRRKRAPSAPSYCEAEAEKTGLFIEKGHTLMKKFISLDF